MTNILDQITRTDTSEKTWYLARVEGTVESASAIKVAELTADGVGSPDIALSATDTFGDVSPPKQNDVVLVLEFASVPFVVGVVGNRTDTEPAHDRDERVINHRHSETTIRIKPDGTVLIDAENIELGEDGSAVARKGDAVSVDPDSGEGTITEGSSSVSSQ